MKIGHKKLFILLLFIVVFLTSFTKAKKPSPFAAFINSMDIVRLPFYYNLVTQDTENAKRSSPAKTKFIESQDYIIGLLPDTRDNYKVLYLRAGDDFYPSLKVFSKTGKMLSDNLICFPDCAGADCDVDSCTSFVEINNSLITRTMKQWITNCDTNGVKKLHTRRVETQRDFAMVSQMGTLIKRSCVK